MKPQTACFTGHRDIPANEYDNIQYRLEAELIQLVQQGVTRFCAGGARGFDMMAAMAVLELRELFPDVKLILILPCKKQTEKWITEEKEIYKDILDDADEIIYTSEHYYHGCMHVHNRRLVDSSDICICYLTKDGGGTEYTVGYAKREGLRVINIASGEDDVFM